MLPGLNSVVIAVKSLLLREMRHFVPCGPYIFQHYRPNDATSIYWPTNWGVSHLLFYLIWCPSQIYWGLLLSPNILFGKQGSARIFSSLKLAVVQPFWRNLLFALTTSIILDPYLNEPFLSKYWKTAILSADVHKKREKVSPLSFYCHTRNGFYALNDIRIS